MLSDSYDSKAPLLSAEMSQKLLEVLLSLLSTNETGTVNTLSLTGSEQPAHVTS